MAPGFRNDREKFSLAVEFTRIIFPSVVFISLSSIYSGLLIARNQFFAFAITPILVNIILISSLLFGESILPHGYRVSCGVLLAGIFQFCYFYWYIRKCGLGVPFFSRIKITRKVKVFLKKMLPILVGAGVAQINVFIDSLLGSILPTGTISYIYFADRLIQFPLAIFGISMGIVLLPEISKKITQNGADQINCIQNDALSIALRMTMPAVIGLISLAYFLISLLYGHGRFSEESVQKTANILRVFALGLPAYVAAKITSFVLFAQKDSKTPIVAALMSIVTNVILSLVLMIPFQGLGIALATTISGFVNFYVMHRRSCGLTINISVFKNPLSASLIMFFFIEILKTMLMNSSNQIHFQIISIFIICLTGMIAYLISLLILRDEVIVPYFQKLRTKFFVK
jgi:putative peptidoglycan lipid II flippase